MICSLVFFAGGSAIVDDFWKYKMDALNELSDMWSLKVFTILRVPLSALQQTKRCHVRELLFDRHFAVIVTFNGLRLEKMTTLLINGICDATVLVQWRLPFISSVVIFRGGAH